MLHTIFSEYRNIIIQDVYLSSIPSSLLPSSSTLSSWRCAVALGGHLPVVDCVTHWGYPSSSFATCTVNRTPPLKRYNKACPPSAYRSFPIISLSLSGVVKCRFQTCIRRHGSVKQLKKGNKETPRSTKRFPFSSLSPSLPPAPLSSPSSLYHSIPTSLSRRGLHLCPNHSVPRIFHSSSCRGAVAF